MKLAALVSGGKDSLYAAWLAKKAGHELVCLVSAIPENPDSYMFHAPNTRLVKVVSECAGIPLLEVPTKGRKEEELEDVKSALGKLVGKIDGIVCGAIASNYQKARLERITRELGLALVAPLWGRPQEDVLRSEIKDGFESIIVHVAAAGLNESWLGRKLDASAFSDLLALQKKFGVSPVGEGGEFETLVLDCPLFSKRIKVLASEKKWDVKTSSGTLEITRAEVADKCLP
ncbi:MAG: TIGR00289 family protein [Candidatus Aenigmatarchaeota archaeon]